MRPMQGQVDVMVEHRIYKHVGVSRLWFLVLCVGYVVVVINAKGMMTGVLEKFLGAQKEVDEFDPVMVDWCKYAG